MPRSASLRCLCACVRVCARKHAICLAACRYYNQLGLHRLTSARTGIICGPQIIRSWIKNDLVCGTGVLHSLCSKCGTSCIFCVPTAWHCCRSTWPAILSKASIASNLDLRKCPSLWAQLITSAAPAKEDILHNRPPVVTSCSAFGPGAQCKQDCAQSTEF